MSKVKHIRTIEYESFVVHEPKPFEQTANTTTSQNIKGYVPFHRATNMSPGQGDVSRLTREDIKNLRGYAGGQQKNHSGTDELDYISSGESTSDATRTEHNAIRILPVTGISISAPLVLDLQTAATLETSTKDNNKATGRPHAISGRALQVDVSISRDSLKLISQQRTATTTRKSIYRHSGRLLLSVLALSLGYPSAAASVLPEVISPDLPLERYVSAHLTGGDALTYALVFIVPVIGFVVMLFIMWMVKKFCRKLSEKIQKNKKISQTTKFWGLFRTCKNAKSTSTSISDWSGIQIISDKNVKSDKEIGTKLEIVSKGSTVQASASSNVMKQQAAGNQKRIPHWHTILDERKSIEQALQRSRTWNRNKLTKQKTVDLDDGCSTSLGQLRYSLSYDFDKAQLKIRIIEARGLPSMDLCGYSDPYVKLYMLSNFGSTTGIVNTRTDNCLFKTRIHKRTLNPVFNETFQCDINYGDLCQKTLVLSVYDYDRLSKHDEIGQVAVPLVSFDYSSDIDIWSDLRKSESSSAQLGDICLSLRYVPTSGKLTVVVQEARKLKKMDLGGLSDPYVKLALMCNGVRLKKRKTSTKKCTLNPRYNESFSFEVPFEQIQNVHLVVTVIDYDRIGTSEPIGRIVMGCANSTGDTEQCHWMSMLASPRRPIVQWHSLRSVSGLDSSYNGLDNLSTTTSGTLLSTGKECSSLSDSNSSH